MKFLDLFAGIGGFHEGMTRAGHECVGFCEYDKYAVASYTSMYLITEAQREYLATLPLKQRQKEILKEEYRNGMWYRQDIRAVNAGDVPRADIWAFGSPCQDFSLAGRRAGLQGDRSSLIREIFRLISETVEELRPKWLVYENVKGMLSSNGGRDYLAILTEMDRWGYDTEWCLINSKEYVPQNRERIYTVGHLRAYGRKEIFPLKGTDGKDSVHGIEQVGQLKSERSNSNAYRVYSAVGIAPTLSTMEGGGREPHIIEEAPIKRIGHAGKFARYMQTYDPQGKCEALDTGGGADTTHTLRCRERELTALGGIDYNKGGQERTIANALMTKDYGIVNHKQTGTAVLYASETPTHLGEE